MATYNKLVRDNIPDIIREDGKTPVTRTLSEEEFKVELKKKIIEEAQELINAESKDDILEEFIDVQTVLLELAKVFGIGPSDIDKAFLSKGVSRGFYNDRIFLVEVKE